MTSANIPREFREEGVGHPDSPRRRARPSCAALGNVAISRKSSRRRRRSILPLAFVGRAGSTSQRDGTMYEGNTFRSAVRTAAEVVTDESSGHKRAADGRAFEVAGGDADHRSLANGLERVGGGLDLAELDAMTATLDLRVLPSEEVDQPVIVDSRAVTGAVQARGQCAASEDQR